MTEPTILSWRKSTRSSNQGACVEVAVDRDLRVWVRDSKDRDGGTLAFRAGAWRGFLAELPGNPDAR
ncbi:DUF397 domain-containing protein [Plantactinospora sp. WMMB782]|uniref:DUF397 domain-containing protein n=1 Tax=Plantactinospora sp. WMMB782 TaxID=3404121 RepID=UPI003B961C08